LGIDINSKIVIKPSGLLLKSTSFNGLIKSSEGSIDWIHRIPEGFSTGKL